MGACDVRLMTNWRGSQLRPGFTHSREAPRAPATSLRAPPQNMQAGFVVRCIHHLQQVHGSSSAGEQPFRLVLVGYSMGGVVASAALRQLAADPAFGELACKACSSVVVAGPWHLKHCIFARQPS